jgi:hypothetical protein
MNDDVESVVKAIEERAPVVVVEHVASEAAAVSLRAAGAALLARVVEIVKPAVRAVGTRPELSSTWITGGGEFLDDDDGTASRAPWRAINLTGGPFGPGRRREGRSDFTGTFYGWDIALTEDGKLIRLDYEGSWSQWQGQRSSWTSTQRELTVDEALAAGMKLETALESIGDQLEGSGDRAKATAAMLEQAAKLRAILALL